MFGLVLVLNGGKICIEKMLGFRGDVVRLFLNPCFCFNHNLVITHPILVIQNSGYTRLLGEQISLKYVYANLDPSEPRNSSKGS